METERAPVSAISLRHILASPEYAPGTIAVIVTWMERGFNADGQTHSSLYPSIFNRLRIARYWSEIATFSYPLAFNAPVGMFPLEFRGKVWSSEN